MSPSVPYYGLFHFHQFIYLIMNFRYVTLISFKEEIPSLLNESKRLILRGLYHLWCFLVAVVDMFCLNSYMK